MTPLAGFVGSFLLTLLLLAGTAVTGFRAQRRRHLPLVFLSLVSLGTTIWFAEKLGEGYDLETAGVITPIHLALAKTATLSYLLPLVTGPITMRRPEFVRWHRISAILVLVLTVLAASTGMTMVLLAEPL
jgi:hypothetical protein